MTYEELMNVKSTSEKMLYVIYKINTIDELIEFSNTIYPRNEWVDFLKMVRRYWSDKKDKLYERLDEIAER